MAVYYLEDVKLFVHRYDFSGQVNECALNYGVQILDKTTFGSDGNMEFQPGLQQWGLDHSGFDEYSDDGTDEEIFAAIGEAARAVTIGLTDGDNGNPCALFEGGRYTYEQGARIGALMGFKVRVEPMGGKKFVRGTILHAKAARTATGNGTAYNLGAVTATQYVYGALHVFARSGTTPTLDVIIQSDDASGMVSPTSRITFTQATAITSEFKRTAGAITDTWWRANYTIGGASPSFTFAVAAGIV